MDRNRVCAIVVSFHPDAQVLENLSALRPQVEHLTVVDNGSSEVELDPLRAAAAVQQFELIENGANLGIATALNQGVRLALDLDAAWILLFDQDSRVTEGFVQTMIACFASSRWGERLVTLVPRYVDRRNGLVIDAPPGREGIESAMTSGSLFRAQTFRVHGLFEDRLFIDGVDHEYSLRLRRRGLVIDECAQAILLHSPGDPHEARFRGRYLFRTANYSAARRYYQERNKIWIARRYFRSFPGFCVRLFTLSAKDFAKIMLGEPNSGRKLAWFLRGIFDGLREKMGPIE